MMLSPAEFDRLEEHDRIRARQCSAAPNDRGNPSRSIERGLTEVELERLMADERCLSRHRCADAAAVLSPVANPLPAQLGPQHMRHLSPSQRSARELRQSPCGRVPKYVDESSACRDSRLTLSAVQLELAGTVSASRSSTIKCWRSHPREADYIVTGDQAVHWLLGTFQGIDLRRGTLLDATEVAGVLAA